jgi:hypothetical protein
VFPAARLRLGENYLYLQILYLVVFVSPSSEFSLRQFHVLASPCRITVKREDSPNRDYDVAHLIDEKSAIVVVNNAPEIRHE